MPYGDISRNYRANISTSAQSCTLDILIVQEQEKELMLDDNLAGDNLVMTQATLDKYLTSKTPNLYITQGVVFTIKIVEVT